VTVSIQIIRDLVIIFGSSAVLVFILNRLRVPSIVGYLFAGLLLGPYGLGSFPMLPMWSSSPNWGSSSCCSTSASNCPSETC